MQKFLRGFVASLALVPLWAAAWTTSVEKDPMTGKSATYASVTSSNSLALSFPYSGANYGQLTVRKHPKYGLDVYLSFEKGQALCRSYEPCRVAVKFDDAAPVFFSGYPPDDHGSNTVFLAPESKFIARAAKAKTILVQVLLYREGEQIFKFGPTTPLVWAPAK